MAVSKIVEMQISLLTDNFLCIVKITEQQRFILSPKRLRDLCLKKATTCIWNKAAKKI